MAMPGQSRSTGAETPDLVFVDPPYEMIAECHLPLFARLGSVLAPERDALVVFEMPGETVLSPPGWTIIRRLDRGARQPTAAIFRQA